MKSFFYFAFIFLAAFLKAQDSSYCYNSGKASVEVSEVTEAPAFIKQENSLILMPVMNAKDVLLILKEKDNSEINKLIKNFKLSKTLKNIGFSAIPEALLGAGFISASGAAISKNETKNSVHQNIGIGLVALSAVCLSSSLCFKIVRAKNYKKALELADKLVSQNNSWQSFGLRGYINYLAKN